MEKRPQDRPEPFRIFRHHEVAGVEDDELGAGDLGLYAACNGRGGHTVLRSDDKRRARLNCISHLLSLIPYEQTPTEKIELPSVSKKRSFDDQATLKDRRFVPAKY